MKTKAVWDESFDYTFSGIHLNSLSESSALFLLLILTEKLRTFFRQSVAMCFTFSITLNYTAARCENFAHLYTAGSSLHSTLQQGSAFTRIVPQFMSWDLASWIDGKSKFSHVFVFSQRHSPVLIFLIHSKQFLTCF